MAAEYLLQRRETNGFSKQFGNPIAWTPWRTVGRFVSFEKADAASRPGLYQWRVKYRGKVVTDEQ